MGKQKNSTNGVNYWPMKVQAIKDIFSNSAKEAIEESGLLVKIRGKHKDSIGHKINFIPTVFNFTCVCKDKI